jgi:glycosyltransferase involved in cell wall biosynthesis
VTEEKAKPVIVLSGGPAVQHLAAKWSGDGKMVDPLLSKDYDIAFLYGQVADEFRGRGMQCFKLDDGTTGQDNNDAINWAVLQLTPLIQSLRGRKQSKVRSCLPQSQPHLKTVSGSLLGWMPGYVVSSLARMHMRIDVWKRFWDSHDVRLVVTHEDVAEDTRALAQFAKARGTPTLHVPHFNHGSLPRPIPDVHDTVQCDYAAVAGEYMAGWLEQRGMGRERIRVTGHPAWDRFAHINPDRYWSRAMLRLNPARPAVCYAADWVLWTTLCYHERTPNAGWQAMLEAFKVLGREGWLLICKSHPGAKVTNAEWHAKEAQKMEVSCLVTDQHLDIILQAADVMVSNGFSNIIAEAAMAGVPAITLGPGYLDEPAAPSVDYDSEALVQAIKDAHTSRQAWQADLLPAFLERYVGPNDGKATDRIVEWCRELAEP